MNTFGDTSTLLDHWMNIVLFIYISAMAAYGIEIFKILFIYKSAKKNFLFQFAICSFTYLLITFSMCYFNFSENTTVVLVHGLWIVGCFLYSTYANMMAQFIGGREKVIGHAV